MDSSPSKVLHKHKTYLIVLERNAILLVNKRNDKLMLYISAAHAARY